jgi:hypothetical protein
MQTEIMFGTYGLSVILTGVMALVFMLCKKEDGTNCVSDKWKNLIVILVGIGLGLLSVWFLGNPASIQNVVNGLIEGFFTSMSAVGLWKTLGIQTGRDISTTTGGGAVR